jgi:hypothetical protein
MTKKLDIKRVLNSLDRKDYDFYTNLSDEEKKEFSPYVLMRFSSNVNSSRDVQEWFLETTNDHVNKNFWLLSKDHKGLLWKLYATTGIGNSYYHSYLKTGKVEFTNKIEKLVADLNPTMKPSEVKILASLMNDDDVEQLFDELGFDKKQRKEYK